MKIKTRLNCFLMGGVMLFSFLDYSPAQAQVLPGIPLSPVLSSLNAPVVTNEKASLKYGLFFPKGIYLSRLRGEDINQVLKFVKQ